MLSYITWLSPIVCSKSPSVRNCAGVVNAGRCPELTCTHTVEPLDSCCPVCGECIAINTENTHDITALPGGALVVFPNRRAMKALFSTWYEASHLYIMENFLRKHLSAHASQYCELSASLTNNGRISVTIQAIKPTHSAACLQGAGQLAHTINHRYPKNKFAAPGKTAPLIEGMIENAARGYVNKANNLAMDTAARAKAEAANKARSGADGFNKKTEMMQEQMEQAADEKDNSGVSVSVCISLLITLLAIGLI